MSDADDPKSPCVSVCVLDDDDVCMGCYRSAEEITDWFMSNAGQKRDILKRARERFESGNPVKLG